MAKPILITHMDLDGAVCAVLFKAVIPEGQVYYCNYDNVDDTVRRAVEEEKPDSLFITDISIKLEMAEWLNGQPIRKVLLDHHKTAQHLTRYGWALVEENDCGAGLFFHWLYRDYPGSNYWRILDPYVNLVDLTEDWDRWIHRKPRSRQLNMLFHALGRDRFVARFVDNPSVEFNEAECLILELEEEQKQRYIEAALTRVYKGVEEGEAVVCAEQYHSELGEAVLAMWPAVQMVYVLDFARGQVSLRSRNGGVDVSEIARRYGGGGHPSAAGYAVKPKRLPNALSYMIHGYLIWMEKMERPEFPGLASSDSRQERTEK